MAPRTAKAGACSRPPERRNPPTPSGCRLHLAGLLAIWAAASPAAEFPTPSGPLPPLDARGLAGFREFQAAGPHRAFVVAPGGAWAWRGDEATPEAALAAAQADCRAAGEQSCVPYAVDGQLVFDAQAWPRLWGPYASAAAAARRPVGTARGQRFPDLSWRSPEGRPQRLSQLRGKVTVLHFWGSWCPPCRREMPELQHFARQLAGETAIRLLLLQVREDHAAARAWAGPQFPDLPLADSGATATTDHLVLADGRRVPDREIARVFPSTYVIDRHGLVVFAHAGPLPDWPGYLPFLRDVAARSGR